MSTSDSQAPEPSDAAEAGPRTTSTTSSLLKAVPTAALIGVLSALTLLGLSAIAERLQEFVWRDVPDAWGIAHADGAAWWWTIAVLTTTGLLVGATIRWVPGHAGTDPVTTGLVAPPLPIGALPGLALALVLGLAGGVSLGPENPIIAVNVALAVWILARRRDATAQAGAGVLATAGTIGALFATPVAAALVLTETLASRTGPGQRLFDLLFPPLIAAGAGSLTMVLVGAPTFAVDVPDYTHPRAWDLLSVPVIAITAAGLVGLGALALPYLHSAFHRLASPVLALGVAGLLLGVLGVLGGEVTLFKGLDQTKELADTVDDRAWGGLALIAVIKVLALLVAAAAGFRGGRIFPAVFVGVAVGLSATTLVPAVPPALAVAAGTLGAVIAVDRDGWIALFLAAITVGDVEVLPLLCLTLAPLWLVARSLPPFQVHPSTGNLEFGAVTRAHGRHLVRGRPPGRTNR
ncbi:ion channel protein [Janibacter alittae]|uniref:Ion channel protein n=1 Tax=Janibacter alittae TaxID=3115209 RepID=A0ABZ2MJR7_9MICO